MSKAAGSLTLALSLVVCVAAPLGAQGLQVPVTAVSGTDVFSGPSFTVPTALAGTDRLTLTVSGLVSLQSSAYGTNAAGVVVVPGTTGIGGTSTFTSGATTYNFGALLIGNATLGFRQLFSPNAATGLGSAAPPSTLFLDVPLSAIFGGGLAAGTVLELRIADINTIDNAGGYQLSQTVTAVVPEPGSVVLVASGLLALGAVGWRRRGARTAA
jgi:hypothetical protein